MEDITIIIPVKDEEAGLEYLLDNFANSTLKKKYQARFIFVIDIRTSDASKLFASEFSDTIIDQSESTGKGAAVRQAVDSWKENPTEKTVFLDADGSYSFESVQKILEALDEGADVVSGSRFLSNPGRPEGMSRTHIFGNRLLSKISSIKNRRKISDLCTGLWGFSKNSLLEINLNSNGFDLEAEIAGKIRINGFTHKEIEVSWSQRKGGTSKLRSLTDGFIILMRIVRT